MSRIHLRWLRIEYQVSPSLFHSFLIALKVAWIAFQVFSRTKLYRVYKYRNHSTVVLFCRLSDKALMSFMQISHGRNKTYCQSLFSPCCNNLSNFLYGFNNFHLFGYFIIGMCLYELINKAFPAPRPSS